MTGSPVADGRNIAVAVGALGLAGALLLEADVAVDSGLWYPVIYAGSPAVAAAALFVAERPDASRAHLLAVAGWVLVGSVLALAVAVVMALGGPRGTFRSPIVTVASAGLLYLGFLLVPSGLAVWAARHRGLRTGALLALSPVLQSAVAAVLILSR